MPDSISDFFKFRSFITHRIVKVLFWIASALMVLAIPLVSLGALISEGVVAAAGSFFGSVIFALFGILMARIYAEILIVIFGIHDELKSQTDILQR